MNDITNKEQLYVEFLKDIYNAEVLLVPALIFFKNQSATGALQACIHHQILNSRAHIQRLEDLIDDLNESTLENHCRSMRSMIQDAKALVKRCVDPTLGHFVIVQSLLRIVQCKVVVYNSLASMAREYNHEDDYQLLKKCEDEDSNDLNTIKQLQQSYYNPQTVK